MVPVPMLTAVQAAVLLEVPRIDRRAAAGIPGSTTQPDNSPVPTGPRSS
jgi:hypothetical protein